MMVKLSHEATKKAKKVISGSNMIFYMGMKMNLENDNPNSTPIDKYDGMVTFTRSRLECSGQFTSEELTKVDYDSFIEPYVKEIDNKEDSYKLQITKHHIMEILRGHLPKVFED